MAASSLMAFQVNCSVQRSSKPLSFDHFKSNLSTAFKPHGKDLQQSPVRVDISKVIKKVYLKILDAFVDLVFEFDDQPLFPSQRNFAPVSELGRAVNISDNIEGHIPDDFPEGVYIRNGSNPLFGGLKSTKSMFGRSSHAWIEGEGMLHAVYLNKYIDGMWTLRYKNRYVETETYKLEKQRDKPSFLPAIEGDSLAVLSAHLLNLLRFGKVNKLFSNTNVLEHGGKIYSIAENYLPQEIDIFSLETLGDWNVNGRWNRPFTSHPKRAPETGELIMVGVDAVKPFMELGVISADGKELVHKADLNLNRCPLCHEIGVTQRYNVIMDFPITIDINRLIRGGTLIKFEEEEYARIGVMPRYGDASSVCWFDVEPNSALHILNCFEDGDKVVVWGCRSLESVIPGPDFGLNKYEWFSKRLKPIRSSEGSAATSTEDETSFFSCAYEWRLNMKTGEVKERNLTGTKYSMDFPMINGNFTGLKNKFGYTQVADLSASSTSGMPKYGGLAKLWLDEPEAGFSSKEKPFEDTIKVEYHKFGENVFCSGAAFVPEETGLEEDDGWITTFVHDESTDISQVHIVDTRNFCGEPVAKIMLPSRVPYGFHGTFIVKPHVVRPFAVRDDKAIQARTEPTTQGHRGCVMSALSSLAELDHGRSSISIWP